MQPKLTANKCGQIPPLPPPFLARKPIYAKDFYALVKPDDVFLLRMYRGVEVIEELRLTIGEALRWYQQAPVKLLPFHPTETPFLPCDYRQ